METVLEVELLIMNSQMF